METSSVIKFKLGRNKKRGLFITTILSTLFGIGALVFSHSLKYGNGRFVFILAGCFLLLITFFCLISYYHLAKDKFTAIYISDEGVYDISTGNRIGTVLWKDVENIKILDDMSNLQRKYIVLKVKNPNEYIDREPTRSKKRSLELKHQYYGSPICISDRALDCTFDELELAVSEKHTTYKAAHPNA